VTRGLPALLAFLLATLGGWDAWAQSYAPGPPARVPANSISDSGLTTSAESRVGLRSGFLVGPALAFSARSSSLSGGDTIVMEVMELAALAGVLDRRMGFRLAPFSFGASFWSDSVFSNVYARWTLIDLGYDISADGRDAIAVGTSGRLGVSHELGDDLALRAEIGPFVGLYARDRDGKAVPYFDVGGILSIGLVLR
jgi:hypothetical protein